MDQELVVTIRPFRQDLSLGQESISFHDHLSILQVGGFEYLTRYISITLVVGPPL